MNIFLHFISSSRKKVNTIFPLKKLSVGLFLLSICNTSLSEVISHQRYKTCIKSNQIAEQSYKSLLKGNINTFIKKYDYFSKLQKQCNVTYSGEYGIHDKQLLIKAFNYWN